MRSGDHSSIRFGPFEIDTSSRTIRRSGVRIRLQEQPFEVLLALLETPGEIVTREQLRQRLWPEGTFVEFDHALNTAVKKIRAVLCDDASTPRYVETIPRRGYRFLAPVDTSKPSPALLKPDRTSAPLLRLRSALTLGRPSLAAVLGFALLIFSAWLVYRPEASSSQKIQLAVLPFSDLSPPARRQPALEHFPEILGQELRERHAGGVVFGEFAPTSADAFSLSRARASHFDYVVQGAILDDKQHLHVAVQLIRLRDQSCVWVKDFDNDSDDAAAQRALTREIVAQMQGTLASLSRQPR